jgi:hypothetical protein
MNEIVRILCLTLFAFIPTFLYGWWVAGLKASVAIHIVCFLFVFGVSFLVYQLC